jgi:hypothetical protein
LSKSEQALLDEVPFRGTGTPMPPTDPLIYRFYELIMVNGPALIRVFAPDLNPDSIPPKRRYRRSRYFAKGELFRRCLDTLSGPEP